MSAAEFAARSCQPAAALGIYGGGFAGVNFGIKRGAGKLHAIIHQWGTNKFQSLAGMFMAFYSVKLPNPDDSQGERQDTAEPMASATPVPDLSEATTMENVFNSVVEIYGDVSGWDVQRIQNFAHAFESSGFQGDLSTWRPVSPTWEPTTTSPPAASESGAKSAGRASAALRGARGAWPMRARTKGGPTR